MGPTNPPPNLAASLAQIQTVNIRAHVPIVLDLENTSYSQWRRLFDTVFGKFGLRDHVDTAATPLFSDPAWAMINECIVNWLYTTISTNLLDTVMEKNDTAIAVWMAIEELFHDNRLTRAVHLESEFRSLMQGDLSVLEYCSQLKVLAGKLADVGHPVREDNQVVNLLRGLNPRLRHMISSIQAQDPLPSFRKVRSQLRLEEKSLQHHEKQLGAGTQALYAGHPSSSSPAFGSTANTANNKKKKKGKPSSSTSGTSTIPASTSPAAGGGGSGGNFGRSQVPSVAQWQAGFNPWTGMVQAWPMPFRIPGAGVLGPRPGVP
ncbi:unnamed protein product [Urochloa humidicola]